MTKKSRQYRLEAQAVIKSYQTNGDYMGMISNLNELALAGNTIAIEVMQRWCEWAHKHISQGVPLSKEQIKLDGDVYEE